MSECLTSTTERSRDDTPGDEGNAVSDGTERGLATTLDTEEMQLLLVKAQKGDIASLQPLRELLDSRKDLWEEVGDMGAHAELSILRLIAGGNLFVQEAVKR